MRVAALERATNARGAAAARARYIAEAIVVIGMLLLALVMLVFYWAFFRPEPRPAAPGSAINYWAFFRPEPRPAAPGSAIKKQSQIIRMQVAADV